MTIQKNIRWLDIAVQDGTFDAIFIDTAMAFLKGDDGLREDLPNKLFVQISPIFICLFDYQFHSDNNLNLCMSGLRLAHEVHKV